ARARPCVPSRKPPTSTGPRRSRERRAPPRATDAEVFVRARRAGGSVALVPLHAGALLAREALRLRDERGSLFGGQRRGFGGHARGELDLFDRRAPDDRARDVEAEREPQAVLRSRAALVLHETAAREDL